MPTMEAVTTHNIALLLACEREAAEDYRIKSADFMTISDYCRDNPPVIEQAKSAMLGTRNAYMSACAATDDALQALSAARDGVAA